MRTTLDIDEDVLEAAKEVARRERATLGETISRLARAGLNAPPPGVAGADPPGVAGFRPFPRRGALVTNERVDRLLGDDASTT
jgi:hypothetical protein